MLRRFLISTACILFAAAIARGAEPLAPPASGETVRPLIVTRPIFALPASSQPAAKSTARGSATLTHRQPLSLVPTKPVDAPKSADAKNPAPPPWFGASTIPLHRRSLGW